MGAVHGQSTPLAVVGLSAVVVGSGVSSSVGCGTNVAGGVVAGGAVVTGGLVGSGLPSGGVGTGGIGGFGVGGGATDVGAVPVCVHKYCSLVPSCVQVSTMLPVLGRVPGTVGSAIVGSGGIVGRGGGLACASWHAVSSATVTRTPAMPTARLVRAWSAGSCMIGTTRGSEGGSRPIGAIRANGAAGQYRRRPYRRGDQGTPSSVVSRTRRASAVIVWCCWSARAAR